MGRNNFLPLVLFGYLTFSFIFGGSGRDGLFAHWILQIFAAVGLGALALNWPKGSSWGATRIPIFLLLGFMMLSIAQCIPLATDTWEGLPGRIPIADGLNALAIPDARLSLSLDPQASLSTASYALSPLFVLLLALRIGARRLKKSLPLYLSTAAVALVILGLLQVFSDDDSSYYFYEFTNLGAPVGTFANVNHFSSILLMILPFTFFLIGRLIKDWGEPNDKAIAYALLIVTFLFAIVIGVFSAGSVAIYCLFLPITFLSVLTSRGSEQKGMNILIHIGVIGLVAIAAGLVALSPMLEQLGRTELDQSDHRSRFHIWSITLDAARAYWPVGSGIGTFESVIPMFEDPQSISAVYYARAHNEYLQLVLEAGMPGVALMVVAFFWICSQYFKIWGSKSHGSLVTLKKQAFLAVLVLVLHSFVDYPVRTPAISVVLAVCIALIAMPERRKSASQSKEEYLGSKRIVL